MKVMIHMLFLFLALACQQIKITIPDTGRKIVINSLLTTDSLIGVNLCASIYLNDTSTRLTENFVKNATIKVYENGNYLDSLKYTKIPPLGDFELIDNNYHSKTFFPKSGNKYKIIVNAPGKPEATAATTIPGLVKIERVDTSMIFLTNIGPNNYNVNILCSVVFTDPGYEKNFYLFYVFAGTTSIQGTSSGGLDNIVFHDPIVEVELDHGSSAFGMAFSDKSINGKQHSISFTVPWAIMDANSNPYAPYREVIYFRLYSITEDYFKYIQTLNMFLKNYDNPLASPTQVFSNIEGGYGIFGGAAVSCDSIVFQLNNNRK